MQRDARYRNVSRLMQERMSQTKFFATQFRLDHVITILTAKSASLTFIIDASDDSTLRDRCRNTSSTVRGEFRRN